MAGNMRDLNYYYQQPSFAGGELSPDVYGRNDFNKYAVGLSECTNMYALPFGGVVTRAGTEFIEKLTDDADTVVQLIPFTFSSTQNIVLLFMVNSKEKKVYFLANGGIVIKDGSPYTITHDYEAQSIGNIQYAQSADVIFLAESSHKPMKLSRYDTYDWRFEEFVTENGSPYGTSNDTDITISYTSSPTPTISSSASLFKSTDVNTWIRIDEAIKAHESHFKPSEGSLTYTGEAIPINGQWSIVMSGKIQGSFGIEISRDCKKTWENYKLWNTKDIDSFQDSGEVKNIAFVRLVVNATEVSGVVQLNVDSFINYNYAKITKFNNDRSVEVNFEVRPQMQQYGAIEDFTGQYSFAFSSWTPKNGYPSSVAFYQNRLCWASTIAEPVGVWLSATGNYYDYTVEIDQEDDQAISISLLSQSLNKISTLLSKTDLIGFTADGTWRISATGASQGLTAKNILASQQTFEGASNIRPLVINTRALYILNQGATVRDITYDYSTDSYTGDDLTLLARHLFRGHTIKSWCYAQEPDSVVYAVRDDGVMLTLTYNKEQEVYAWAKHTTNGEFVAVQSVAGTYRTLVYFVVRRFGKLYIETLSDRLIDDTTHMNFMDCSSIYEGEKTSTITGLDYLEGQTVQIVADGSEHPVRVVQNGTITLDNPASVIRVGLAYTKKVVTMNLDYPRQDGTSQGRKKSTSIVKILFDKSYGGDVQILNRNTSISRARRVKNELPDKYGKPIELYSGISSSCVNARTDVNMFVGVEQSSPVPINILSIMVDIEWGG